MTADLKSELQTSIAHRSQLQDELKQNDIKMEQISQVFNSELHAKEEQLKSFYSEEL